VENWNYDFGNAAWDYEDYWRNYKPLAKNIDIPVLFFHGSHDFMVGPDHYKTVEFPKMLLWESNVGHIPFQENTEDLKKAILTYLRKYQFQA